MASGAWCVYIKINKLASQLMRFSLEHDQTIDHFIELWDCVQDREFNENISIRFEILHALHLRENILHLTR